MAIELTCPSCGGRLRVSDETAGKQIRCGRCQAVCRVPAPNLDPPAPPPPPPSPFELTDDEPEELPKRPVRRPREEESDADRPRRRDEYEEDDRPRRRRPRDEDEDEYDRPRRRRRYPRESAGHSPLFWIATALGTTVLGSIMCCCYVRALLPGEQWRRHESAAGGFSVDLPAPVRENIQPPNMKLDPDVKIEGTILVKRGEAYVVTYVELLPIGMRMPNEAIIDEVVNRLQNEPNVKRMVRNERITVSGFPGRELEYVCSDGGTHFARVVISDRRAYIVIGGGPSVRPGNANIRRFLDTFSITDKGLPANQPR